MAISQDLLEILACPACKAKVEIKPDGSFHHGLHLQMTLCDWTNLETSFRHIWKEKTESNMPSLEKTFAWLLTAPLELAFKN